MAKLSKLVRVNESIVVNRYDNGWMVEISGKDKKDDWKTAKIMVGSVDELINLVREACEMDRDN